MARIAKLTAAALAFAALAGSAQAETVDVTASVAPDMLSVALDESGRPLGSSSTVPATISQRREGGVIVISVVAR